ncbi:MAG TPA: TorF family putative porin [Gemmatimonadaceae bacterium]
MHFRRALAVATTLSGWSATPAVSQPVLTGNVAVSSAYVWRGVTNTNRPVLQPDLSLGVPLRDATITAGVWASVEPARYDGSSDISAVYGLLPGPAFTQYSAWIEYGRAVAGADLAVGATAYTYPAVANLAADYNTIEVYASLTLPAPLMPRLAAWYDVAAVRGAYVETSLTHDVSIREVPVSLGVVAGLSAGQGPDAATHRQSYFARDGVTHVDLSATTAFQSLGLTISPTLHLIRAFDAMARVTTPLVSRSTKIWLGATLSWTSDKGDSP